MQRNLLGVCVCEVISDNATSHRLHEIIDQPTHFLSQQKSILPPPFKRRMGDYKNADVKSIRRSLSSIEWVRCIQQRNTNNQVVFLFKCISNVFSNFCLNRIIRCCHDKRDKTKAEGKNKNLPKLCKKPI